MAPPKAPSHLNIVLVGVTGTGKSTTGNTMCGREAFKASDSAESETRKCAVERYTHKSCEVCLIDTVGMADTSLTPPEALNRFLEFSDQVHAGVDVFFYTVRRDARFAPQEAESLQAFISNCGEGVLKHTMFVFTHCKEDQQGEAELKEWASQNQSLVKWISRVRGIVGVENEQDPSQACAALHSNAMNVFHENKGKKYSNSALDEARKRRRRLEEETEKLSPENCPEIYQLLVELAAGRCSFSDVEVRLEIVKGREAEKKRKEDELMEAKRKADEEKRRRKAAEKRAKEERIAAEKRAEAESQARKEEEEFYQELQNCVPGSSNTAWEKSPMTSRTIRNGSKKEIVSEVVMRQEVMQITVKYLCDGEKRGEVNVWSEDKTNNGWDEKCPLEMPHTILMEAGPETDLNMLVLKVHEMLRSDIEKSLRVIERVHTTEAQSSNDKRLKKAFVQFSVQECYLKKILFEGEPQNDFNKPLESYRGGQLNFEIKLEVKQLHKEKRARIQCCCAQ